MASKRDCNRSNINALLESLLTVSDSTLMDASFDVLLESRSTDSDQNDFIQRAIRILSVLLEAGKRSDRKHSSVHNASVWPLPPDLTIKVFSMLDTPNVGSAAATCLFFKKCAADPLCYANIDLDTLVHKVNDDDVSTMVQRAGNALQSIKLESVLSSYGNEQSGQRKDSPILTSCCLSSLSGNGGAPGSSLRILHLHNFLMIDNTSLLATLSVCPLLIDLEVVFLNVDVSPTLNSVSKHCRLMERFIYESERGIDDYLDESSCKEFVLNCPKITTLTLQGCELSDSVAFELVKGFQELKHVDFSHSNAFTVSYRLTGAFLKNLATKGGAKNLEVMILSRCNDLKISAVEKFMEALLEGEFRLLRHLDISCTKVVECFMPNSILLKQVLEQRSNFCLVTESYYKPRSDYYGTSDSEEDSEEINSKAHEESSE